MAGLLGRLFEGTFRDMLDRVGDGLGEAEGFNMAAQAPQLDRPPQPPLLPDAIFGLSPNKYTVPTMKRVLGALGIRGYSHRRRQLLMDRLQIAETSATLRQRRTVEWLLQNEGEVSRSMSSGFKTDPNE
jgi:hypothetical protein